RGHEVAQQQRRHPGEELLPERRRSAGEPEDQAERGGDEAEHDDVVADERGRGFGGFDCHVRTFSCRIDVWERPWARWAVRKRPIAPKGAPTGRGLLTDMLLEPGVDGVVPEHAVVRLEHP